MAAWLRDERAPAGHALIELGPAALRRAVEVYYGHAVAEPVADAARARPGREVVDAWAVLLGTLARAFPEVYLAEVDAGRVPTHLSSPTLEMSILGGIDLAGAVEPLCRHLSHPDWLVRYHVVRGLGRRSDPAAVRAVEAALHDPERAVRDEAARWLRRRSQA